MLGIKQTRDQKVPVVISRLGQREVDLTAGALYFTAVMRDFLPCLPTLAPNPPVGDVWLYEIKHDGFRLIVRRDGKAIRLTTKGRVDVTKRYTLVAQALTQLKVKSVVLDGEVCCDTFDELWERENDDGATMLAFDLLELNGTDLRDRPLIERKARLAELLARAKQLPGLHFVEHLTGDGATIFEHVCKLGLEGIVAKRIDMTYQPGRSKRWLKIKNREHVSLSRVREAFAHKRRR